MDKKIYDMVNKRANGVCENCGKGGHLELHHILRRKVPATVDNCIMLCPSCHKGTNGVHGMNGHNLDLKLKMQVQQIYFDDRLKENEVRALMGGRLYF